MRPVTINKRYFPLTIGVVLGIFIAIFLSMNLGGEKDSCGLITHVNFPNNTFVVSVLATASERERGLSGKSGLAKNEGALFLFKQPTSISFWMKDMLFPIDIIFFDSEFRVIGLVNDARPESFPYTFDSPGEMLYTLEVSSGAILEYNIRVGTRASATCK